MTDDRPIEFPPGTGRRERRGEFPVHGDVPRPLLPLDVARRIARDRLEQWRRDHGH